MGAPCSRDAQLSAYTTALIHCKSRQLRRKRGFSRSDEPDIAQDLTFAVLRQAPKFDPARGASRDTFNNRVIQSAAKMLLRDRRRIKRAAGLTALSLDVDSAEPGGQPLVLGQIISSTDMARRGASEAPDPQQAFERNEAMAAVMRSLPPALGSIARRLTSQSVVAVARELGISRRQVYAGIAELRLRFEAAGLNPK